jgi:hypothetical protein
MFAEMAAIVANPLERIGGASRDRTDDLIVANDGVYQYPPLWRALGSGLRSETFQ